MRDITAREHRQLRQPVVFLPDEILEIRVKCPNCARVLTPDWLAKRPPMGTVQATDGTMLRRISAYVRCQCGADVPLKMPQIKERGAFHLFGDEAYRISARGHEIVTYVLVGTNPKNLQRNLDDFLALKKNLLPDRDPQSWRLHMLELWRKQDRSKSALFSEIAMPAVVQFVDSLFRFVSQEDRSIQIFAFPAIFGLSADAEMRKKNLKEMKRSVYANFLFSVFRKVCGSGLRPLITFEADEGKPIAPHWARDAFFGVQSNLLYGWITGGVYVPPLEYRLPLQEPMLELADFAAYVISRACDFRIARKPLDLDDQKLGSVFYNAFYPNGDLYDGHAKGFPFNELYP